MVLTSTGGKFAWWRTALADVGLTLAVAPDLAVVVAPAAGEAEATGAGAQRVAPDPTQGLVPAAIRDDIIPAPGLRESLAPSQENANHVLALADLVLDPTDPTNPNLVHTLANLGLAPPSTSPSLVQRAALR